MADTPKWDDTTPMASSESVPNWDDFAPVAAPQPEPGVLESAIAQIKGAIPQNMEELQGLGQSYLDAAQEAGQSLFDLSRQTQQSTPVIGSGINAVRAYGNELINNVPTAETYAQIAQEDLERAQRSPIATQIGSITGALAPMALPGGQLAGLPGVGIGLGYTTADQALKGDINPEMLTKEAGIGTALAVGLPAVARPVLSKADELARYLTNKFGAGADKAIKGLLKPTAEEIQKDLNTKLRGADSITLDEVAQDLKKRGVFDNLFADRTKLAAQNTDTTGKVLGEIKAGRPEVDVSQLEKDLASQIQQLKASPEALDAQKLQDLAMVRRDLAQKAKAMGVGEEGPSQALMNADVLSQNKADYGKIFRESGEKNVSAGNKAQIYKDLERSTIPAEKLDDFDKALRQHAVTSKGFEKMAEMSAKSAGQMPITKARILANYGSELAAVGLNKLSKMDFEPKAAKALTEAMSRGGATAVLSTHYLLMQQDPAYRKNVEEQSKPQEGQDTTGQAVYDTSK